ncbi:hypothetical protein [Desulfurella sp.]|uniref:hypothetical protein n=1 Tax=Desulfurella sp. TaxID=1962857 RepID=UPI0025C3E49D|nr:hypothetical protein [Desulfurella sp.]
MVESYPIVDVFNAYFNYQVKFSNLYSFFNEDSRVNIQAIKDEFKKIAKKHSMYLQDRNIPVMTTLKSLTSKSYKFWQADFYDPKNSIFIELELNTQKHQSAWVNAIGQTFMYIADENYRHSVYIIFIIDKVIKRELNNNDKYLLDFLTQVGIYCYSIYLNDKNEIKSYTTIPSNLFYER